MPSSTISTTQWWKISRAGDWAILVSVKLTEKTIISLTSAVKSIHINGLGLIRTPIPAHITFLDDPLRVTFSEIHRCREFIITISAWLCPQVLRAIRFSSRFNFRLDEELEAAAKEEDVRAALACKVSRERIYKECEGIFAVRGKVGNFDKIADAFQTMNRCSVCMYVRYWILLLHTIILTWPD